MSLERAAMRGKLAELKDNERRLRARITGSVSSVRQGLNLIINKPEELDIPVLDEHWDALKSAWMELNVTLSDIRRIEKELA
jgi:hypothetical protein